MVFKFLKFLYKIYLKFKNLLYIYCSILLTIFRKIKNSLYSKFKKFLLLYCQAFLIYFYDIKNLLFFENFFIRKKLLFLNPKNFKKNKLNKKKKKIILVISSLSLGGAERQVLRLAEHLTKKKIKCKIFVMVKNKKNLTYFFPKYIHVDYLRNKKSKVTNCVDKKFINDLNKLNFFTEEEKRICLGLYNYVKKENPDVIHAFLDFCCISTGYIGLYLNIRRIVLSTRNVSPHHFMLNRNYFKEFYKSLLKFKNIILVNNSKAGARSYEKWLNIKKNSIRITYNVFDFNKKIKLKKIKKKLNSINFVSVIRLEYEKDPIYILKLAKNLIKQNLNYYFYIIGQGHLKIRLKEYIKKNQLNKNVRLLGIKNNIYDYLNFADFTLLTSVKEGTPNVLLESQKVGTPVITSDVGGTKETFVKNYSGYLIGKKSIKEDCNIINNIAQNNIKKKIDLKIIKKKLKKFSPHKSIQQVLNLYK